MSEKGQGNESTLGAAAGAAAGTAEGGAAGAGGEQADQRGPVEFGQGLLSFQPEINIASDVIVDSNSQTVDADSVGAPAPPAGGTPGARPPNQ